MAKFYFTYGTDGHPYSGGWTEVMAPSKKVACELFKAVHPCVFGDFLNCCSVYTEEQMKKTTMYEKGNFGAKCHETITITIERKEE